MKLRTAFALGVVAVMLVASPAGAQEQVAEVDWSTTTPLSGEVEDGRVVIDAGGAGVYPVTVLESPPLSGGDIVLSVEVAFAGFADPGFLELWAVYDDGSRFFSRSLDANGVGVLRSSGDDTVGLAFGLAGTVPSSLELNAVMPAGGRIEIGAVTLQEFGAVPALVGDDTSAWWSVGTASIVFGVAGALVGVLGALVGSLASRGAARGFVVPTMRVAAFVGIGLAGAGLVALAIGQPYEVWFPLLLLGVIMTFVFGGMSRTVEARYEARELQRMRAFDTV